MIYPYNCMRFFIGGGTLGGEMGVSNGSDAGIEVRAGTVEVGSATGVLDWLLRFLN